MTLDHGWLREIEEHVPDFLRSLRVGTQAGRYLPCLRGATAEGREMGLGWSCFALKTLHMLRRWELLDRDEREAWIEFIQEYQRTDGDSYFEDPPEIEYLRRPPSFKQRLLGMVGRGEWKPEAQSIALAETKQAIATLAEVGEEPRRPFRGFPSKPEKVRAWLEAQDWTRPWGAGGQSAGLVVFIKTQAPLFLPERDVNELLSECREFFADLANAETGAYFRGPTPAHGELVNGAMKVLMALDWLGAPVHHPERLSATVLAAAPKAEGCHLVDAIYVLHRALAGRRADDATREFCMRVVDMIRAHANEDGGFSFYVRRAQTNYYGVPVSRGLDESDVQGTCLLVWALAMIRDICEPGVPKWKLIKP